VTKRKAKAGEYVIRRGISWPEGAAEAGEVRSDLPPEHVADWIECGAIEPAEEGE
jgi:hypothetical protein